MTGAQLTFGFEPVWAAVSLLITAGLAYFLARRLDEWPAVLIAGLALPIASLVLGAYQTATVPDDIPRGLLLIGVLGAAAVATPITLIVSYLTVRYARR